MSFTDLVITLVDVGSYPHFLHNHHIIYLELWHSYWLTHRSSGSEREKLTQVFARKAREPDFIYDAVVCSGLPN